MQADDRTRTDNLLITNQLLCQLSHIGIFTNGTYRARTYDPLLVRQMLSQLSYDPITTQKRLELSTSAVTGRRSNQLSHWAMIVYECYNIQFINGPSGTRTQDRPVMSRLL